jgi:hypothetical protein
MPARGDLSSGSAAGDRKPPRKEPAGHSRAVILRNRRSEKAHGRGKPNSLLPRRLAGTKMAGAVIQKIRPGQFRCILKTGRTSRKIVYARPAPMHLRLHLWGKTLDGSPSRVRWTLGDMLLFVN